MARHLAGELHNEVIEGSGPEARLRFVVEPRRLRLGANGGLDGFKRVFQETLNTGATRVEETFTNGSDAEHRWWPLAARRYRNLGKAAVKAAPPVFDPIVNDKVAQVPREGQNLKAALRTQALSDLLPFYGDLVRTLDGTEEQRVEAAHSLVHILTSLAGIHGSELLTMMARRRLRAFFGGQVVRDPATGTYRVTYPPSNQPQGPKAYERLQDLPSTTIKCAARPYIKNFAHAAINAAAERHLM